MRSTHPNKSLMQLNKNPLYLTSITVVKHASEFDRREAFACCVVSPTGDTCLGCVYIDPSGQPRWDAAVTLWGLDEAITNELYAAVRQFVDDAFPFRNPAFPFFEIPPDEWKKRHKTFDV